MAFVGYFDEAGISNPTQEPFVVVAGVVVDADKKLVALKRHLDKIVERHIPEKQRDGFIFHAKELFNGTKAGSGKPFERAHPDWPMERRLAIADELAATPKKFHLPLTYGFVERAKFPHTVTFEKPLGSEEKTLFEHVTAYMTCAMEVEHWMREHAGNQACFIVVEDNERARKLIRDTQVHHQDPRILKQLDEASRRHFPFRRLMEDPSFQPKRPSSVLQLSDFCAYVFKRILMGDMDRYGRFYGAMRAEIPDFSKLLAS